MLYPNPVMGTLNISLTESMAENASVQIIDCLGQVALDIPFTQNLDVSMLAKGVYYLKINKENNIAQCATFIKE